MQYFSIISLFPEFVEAYKHMGVVGKAVGNHLIDIKALNPRDFAENERRVDDSPYGGGPGMVMMIEPIAKCINQLKSERQYDEIIYMTPDGEPLEQKTLNMLSTYNNIIILAGHYKGVDQRVRDIFVTKEKNL